MIPFKRIVKIMREKKEVKKVKFFMEKKFTFMTKLLKSYRSSDLYTPDKYIPVKT